MSTLISAKEVTARKPHWCMGCGTTIQPRERYRREAHVSDCRAYTWTLCLPCWGITYEVEAWSSSGDGIAGETYAEWAEEAARVCSGDMQQAALEYLRRCAR